MLLDQYLKKKNISVSQFAKLSSISINTLYNILKGVQPRFPTLQKLEISTRGKVSIKDFMQMPSKVSARSLKGKKLIAPKQ